MNINLNSSKEITTLKRNSKLQANHFYLLSSESVAKNLYFSSKKDIEFAHQIFKKHIGCIGEVIDYLIKPTGWIIVLKTYSEVAIISSFKKKSNKSLTIKRAIRKKEVHVLISETMRSIISIIGRQINRNNKRKGAVVKGNFSRYIFNSFADVVSIMNKMKEEILEITSQTRNYQPKVKNWLSGFIFEKGSVILCSKNRNKGKVKGLITLNLLDINLYVLRDYFRSNNSLIKHKKNYQNP